MPVAIRPWRYDAVAIACGIIREGGAVLGMTIDLTIGVLIGMAAMS